MWVLFSLRKAALSAGMHVSLQPSTTTLFFPALLLFARSPGVAASPAPRPPPAEGHRPEGCRPPAGCRPHRLPQVRRPPPARTFGTVLLAPPAARRSVPGRGREPGSYLPPARAGVSARRGRERGCSCAAAAAVGPGRSAAAAAAAPAGVSQAGAASLY